MTAARRPAPAGAGEAKAARKRVTPGPADAATVVTAEPKERKPRSRTTGDSGKAAKDPATKTSARTPSVKGRAKKT